MPKLIYSMGLSLDGFIEDPDGSFDWSAPDEELHRFHNERVRALGGHLLGRRLYETMTYWETAHKDPASTDYTLEFAEIWKVLPKVVFSNTLAEVIGDSRLARGSIAEEVAELQQRSGKDVAIGGPTLAAGAIQLGLVDEFQLFVYPVVAGGGKSLFPPGSIRAFIWISSRRAPSPRASFTCATSAPDIREARPRQPASN